MTIEGPSGAVALLNRGNTNNGSYVVQMAGATDVTIENLELTGGSYGIYAPGSAGSTGLTVSNSVLFGNQSRAPSSIPATTTPASSTTRSTASPISPMPTRARRHRRSTPPMSLLTGNIVYDSSSDGITSVAPDAAVTGNTAYGNATGISASGSGTTRQRQHGLRQHRRPASPPAGRSWSRATPSTGRPATPRAFPSPAAPQATDNTVYGNTTGISVSYGGLVSDNRVYDNSGAGITRHLGSTTDPGQRRLRQRGRHRPGELLHRHGVEQRPGGEHDGGHPRSRRRLMAARSIWTTTRSSRRPAMRCRWTGARSTRELLNNILWAQSGYDIAVAADSEIGFQSDYDLFYSTGTGCARLLAGADHPHAARLVLRDRQRSARPVREPAVCRSGGPRRRDRIQHDAGRLARRDRRQQRLRLQPDRIVDQADQRRLPRRIPDRPGRRQHRHGHLDLHRADPGRHLRDGRHLARRFPECR